MPTTASPLPPTPKEHWLFGSIYYLAKDPLHFLGENIPKYPHMFRVTSRFRQKIMVLTDPEHVKYILQDNNRNYIKSFGYEIIKLLLGNGLLTSEGEFWRRQRRLAQPAFHRERLAALADTMVACTDESIARLEQQVGKGPINITREMMALTLEVVARSLFSSDVKEAIGIVAKELEYVNEAAVRRINNPLRLPNWVPTPNNLAESKSINNLNKVVQDIIDKRRQDGQRYDDLLAMLMEAVDEETGETMSDLQLRDESMTIFLAGHETTAVALSWIWYLLDRNPEKAMKLREEVDTVLQGRKPTLEDLMRLPYARMVVDESMRLYPPAWIVGRRNVEDDEIGGYHVPAMTNIMVPVYFLHRDPRYWDEPSAFKPERFEKDKLKNMPRFAYMPFGGGPRLCIGNNFALMEMHLIVVMLVQRFRFVVDPSYKPQPDPLVTLRPKGGITARVEKA
ncbi:MAG: cytochrome P450 [Chitinophagales bacterium]|nr:cytochrome P450 [Chitinophagales bacterium]